MSVSDVTSVSSASNIQMDYMKLLVTQLKNQNPLEPLNNDQMASQLAQFSSLQQLENMNGSFTNVLGMVQGTYANSLIGKEVSFLADNGDGTTQMVSGVAEGVTKENNKFILSVGNYRVNVDKIIGVRS